jgi:hypothetical protein
VTFVDWQDIQRWKLINDALALGLAEPAETYSTSEHLYAELAIPPDATGTLPREQRDRAGLAAEDAEDLGETGATRSKNRRSRSGNSRSGKPRSGGSRSEGTRTAAAGAEVAATGDRTKRRRRRTRGGREIEGDRKLS